ncbi:O-antigen ligase family protein [Arcicella sp. LKC2W]|uniref:O-antigen ligase family protein n=1 Tax=Arcicella sp. LKC2W TaxID=2984198 RepID=UPI002B20585E|nr:O-antigen ligase family protein [Arcicella sp. LKC2W]MEA5458968.1 O-antigen ligase family protein [Arcicella sp. LKC2W]
MPLFFRFISDFFWNYKSISMVVNVYAIYYLVLSIAKQKSITNSRMPKYISIVIILFYIFLLNAYLIKTDEQSTKIFAKISISLLLFFIGVLNTSIIKDSQKIAKLCSYFLVLELAFALTNNGFQFWGDVKTFSGYFFFKTDLALATVISLVYIIYFSQFKTYLLYFFISISLFLIYIANSRIHLLTFFLIVAIYFSRKTLLNRLRFYLLFLFPLILILFYLFNLIISNFQDSSHNNNYLTLNFSNFYSAENLQGRDQIWNILMEKFKIADVKDKFLGLGLSADIKLNDRFSENTDSNNAHNNYLFLLISMGYLGSFFFYLFSIISLKKFFKNAQVYSDEKRRVLLLVFISHIILFFTSSFSSSTLIFQQETWFYMFFSGMLYNKCYFPKV